MHLPCPVRRLVRRRVRVALPAAFVLAVVATLHGPARGQPVTNLDPLVVTAARMPQRLTDLLADVTVIGLDEIRRSGASSLAELLQRQPGAEIVQNGGPGASSGVFLRGANAAQTLVLVDGLRIASSTAGAAALEAIPLASIERIEILRGPSSSLYGADAIGGVIQVFTRQAGSRTTADAALGYGSHDTWAGSAAVTGGSETLRGALQVGARRSAGFGAIVNPANFSFDPDRDGFSDRNVSAQGVLTLAPAHELSAQFFRSRLDSRFDAGDAFDDRTVTTLTAWQVALADRFAPAWSSRLSAGEGTDESVSDTAFGGSPFRTRQRQYAWQNDLALDALQVPGRLALALERREERVATDPVFATSARTTNAVTAVYALAAGPHALQANLRNDDSSQYGSRTTGALAYGFQATPALRFTVGGGTAFKAPTFNDLYYPGFSNPDLKPETARSVEVGVRHAFDVAGVRIESSAVAWRNRVRDLIVFQCDASFVCAPANVADATLEGVTLGVDAVARTASVRASATLQSPEDDATGRILPRRARRHGSVQLLSQAGPGTVGVELVAASQRFDDAENTRALPGYLLVNLTAEWPLSPQLTLFVRGDNVLDRHYQLAADYATGGARVFGGLRWHL